MPAPASTRTRPAPLPGASRAVWRDKLSQLLESTGEGIFGRLPTQATRHLFLESFHLNHWSPR